MARLAAPLSNTRWKWYYRCVNSILSSLTRGRSRNNVFADVAETIAPPNATCNPKRVVSPTITLDPSPPSRFTRIQDHECYLSFITQAVLAVPPTQFNLVCNLCVPVLYWFFSRRSSQIIRPALILTQSVSFTYVCRNSFYIRPHWHPTTRKTTKKKTPGSYYF